jgi:hypothetical protein
VSFPSALLRRLPFFTVKRKVEAHQPASAPAAVPEQVSAPIEAACGDSSADVGTSRQIGSSRKDEVLPQASAGVGTPQRQSSDSGMPKAVASADIGLPRRLLEEDLGSFAFTPHDDEKIHPDRYQLLQFLSYGEIADEFVKWVQSSPRTAFLRGWPVTVDEVWDLASSVFQYETYITIESRNTGEASRRQENQE